MPVHFNNMYDRVDRKQNNNQSMIQNIKSLNKTEQYRLMNSIKPYLGDMSQSEIARQADVSQGLVGHVMAGLNSNSEVLRVIFANLSTGWEDAIPGDLKHIINQSVLVDGLVNIKPKNNEFP